MMQMAVEFEGATPGYLLGLTISNYIFTAIFGVEAVLKLIAFRKSYFNSDWNKFDFVVVISSFADIILTQVGSGLEFLRVGP